MHTGFQGKVLLIGALAATLVIPNSTQAAGWFYFDPVELDVEIRFDGYDNETDATTGPADERQTLQLEERISVGQSGSVVDPRIVNFSVLLEPVFRQGRETADGVSDRTGGNDLDYKVGLGFLQDARFWFDGGIEAYRTTGSNDLAFGSRNRTAVSSNELRFSWKNAWFPMSFSYLFGSFEQDFARADGLLSRRDEDRDRLRITGRSSKLRLDLQSERVQENVFGRDYDLNRGNVEHQFGWGRGSHLYSTIRLFDRRGFNAFRQVTWQERVNIRHTDNLDSRSFYRYFSLDSDFKSRTQEGEFRLLHKLYKNLDSEGHLWGRSERADTQDVDEYEVGGRSGYDKEFFFGRLSAGLYGSYRATDRVSLAGTGEVVDERQTASFVDPLVLGKQLVDAATVVVSAADGFIYDPGVDYELNDLGGVYTEVRIIPTGRITPGDALLISYRYELLPSADYTSLTAGYNLSLAYRWLRLYHNGYRADYRLVSGAGLPPDQEYRASGVELSWEFDFAAARLRGETRYRQNGGFESRNVVLNQSLGFTLTRKLRLAISANQVLTETSGSVYPDPLADPGAEELSTSAEYYALDASLTWNPRPNLSVTPAFGVWKREETSTMQGSRDTNRLYYSGRLRVSWLLRQLALDFFYDYNVSDIDDLVRTGNRVYLSAKRRFR
jgi:hypothetical protein